MTVEDKAQEWGNKNQVIKTRDDKSPVFLDEIEDPDEVTKPFVVVDPPGCAWASAATPIGSDTLRERIEPWLTALLQSEHLSLLVGSGLTHAVHRTATGKAAPGMEPTEFGVHGEAIALAAKESAMRAGRAEGNFEDDIRAATELARGVEIAAGVKAPDDKSRTSLRSLRDEISERLNGLADSILEAERNVATAPEPDRDEALNQLVSFLMSFASRTGTRERLQIFTTNYDRLIEAAADMAGLRLIDRFVGSIAPIFRSSRLDVDMHYNPPGIRGEPRYLEGVARFTKLHGSVDWYDTGNEIRRIGMPFGAKSLDPYLDIPGIQSDEPDRLMVYPNASKDRETAAYPYVELFRDLAAAVCRPNSTLVTYGYSFGDEHINRVIEDMLTVPSSHLVIIAFGDPLGRIQATYRRLGRPSQVTLLVGNHLGDLASLVNNYLPKASIDRTTLKMTELLRARWGSSPSPSKETPPGPLTGAEPGAS